jgi:hypothetical protein
MAQAPDWRLRGQENYLTGAAFVHRPYRRYAANPAWDHDHCAFCWEKFMLEDQPDVLHEGYATTDDYFWICERCFKDFRHQFGWRIIADETQQT